MNLSDPYLLRFLIEADHEQRLREADEERLARTISGGVPPRRRRRRQLRIRLLPELRRHAHRPGLSA